MIASAAATTCTGLTARRPCTTNARPCAGPRRLARPRTPAFHAGNTGSNPVGDTFAESPSCGSPTQWRIVYRIDGDAIVIGEIFERKSAKTPRNVIEQCRKRFAAYDRVVENGKQE